MFILTHIYIPCITSARRTRRNNKIGPIRDVFKKWSSSLQDKHDPGLRMMDDEQLITYKGCCLFQVHIPSKPGKYKIKICIKFF